MDRLSRIAWRRLSLSVLVAAGLSALFDFAPAARGAPAGAMLSALAFDLLLVIAIFALLIPCLYGIARAADKFGIAGWAVFPVLFVALCAGISCASLSGFDLYETGAGASVTDHRIAALGWSHWKDNAAGILAIALTDTIILFGWPSHWFRLRS